VILCVSVNRLLVQNNYEFPHFASGISEDFAISAKFLFVAKLVVVTLIFAFLNFTGLIRY